MENPLHKLLANTLKELLDAPSYESTEAMGHALAPIFKGFESAYELGYFAANGKNVNLSMTTRKPHADRPWVMLNAHMDTVPFDRTRYDDWKAACRAHRIDGNHVYGLGAVNCKASIVMMLRVLTLLMDEPGAPNVWATFVCDEEAFGVNGTLAMMEHKPAVMDYVVIGAPTDLRITREERGVIRFTVTATGAQSHVGAKGLGGGAAVKLAEAIVSLEKHYRNRATASLNIGVLLTDTANPNTTPGYASAKCDMRFSGSQKDALMSELRGWAHYAGVDVFFDQVFNSIPEKETVLQNTFYHVLKAAGRNVRGHAVGSSDARWLPISTDFVCFGPGDGTLGHSANERVNVADIDTGARLLLEVLLKLKRV